MLTSSLYFVLCSFFSVILSSLRFRRICIYFTIAAMPWGRKNKFDIHICWWGTHTHAHAQVTRLHNILFIIIVMRSFDSCLSNWKQTGTQAGLPADEFNTLPHVMMRVVKRNVRRVGIASFSREKKDKCEKSCFFFASLLSCVCVLCTHTYTNPTILHNYKFLKRPLFRCFFCIWSKPLRMVLPLSCWWWWCYDSSCI